MISSPSKPKSRFIIPALLLIIILSVLLSLSPEKYSTSQYRSKLLREIGRSSDFESFQNNLFKYEVTSDSITKAYTLKSPEKLDIPDLKPILTDFSSKGYANDSNNNISKNTVNAISSKLSGFPKENLSIDDRITYELLKKHLDLAEQFCNYSYYETLLGKTSGAAANLPVTLSEYPLNDSSDIDTYLSLLTQVPEYYDSVIGYENERIQRGMATPYFILKDTEDQLTRFVKDLKTDNNCFITTFNDRTRDITSLEQKERSKYISVNKYYVNRYIIPAYEKLLRYVHAKANLTKDKNISSSVSGSQSENADHLPDTDTAYGLTAYPKGGDYYKLLIKDATGSEKSPEEMIHMTEEALNQALSDVLCIATTDTDAYMYYCDNPGESGFHSPEGILEALSLMIREDYPELKTDTSYRIKTVPASLAEMVSPAFYMIPAIDDYKDNTIYINPLYTSDENGNLFTTLAHEGFPGHLYQTVYYNSTNPAPIRQILDYPGYVEGWATYVELNSFSFINYSKHPESLPILYRSDAIINLALSSRIDIGVNYEGWTLNDTCRYFEDLGFNSYYASDIYSYVVEAPANYLSYFIGYLEIENIKREYQNLKMENYSDYDFHKALLDIGPADFETIRKYLLK